jgi:hypothetical protein
MATCPKGHESATADYCDVCGAPMAGPARTDASAGTPPGDSPAMPASADAAVAASPGAAPGPTAAGSAEQAGPAGQAASATLGKPCPICGTPQSGRFCEVDGYDFLLAPPVDKGTGDPAAAPAAAVPGSAAPAAAVPGSAAPVPAGSVSDAPAVAAPGAGEVVVGADRTYFDAVTAMGGEDAGSLSFPRFVAERRFPLIGKQLLVGRRSRSRGVQPDIDLIGPPEDPGVSHTHALLVAESDGWAVVDLGSANGTYLNDPSANPIEPNTPVPVKDGDRIFLGAWTVLTIRTAG